MPLASPDVSIVSVCFPRFLRTHFVHLLTAVCAAPLLAHAQIDTGALDRQNQLIERQQQELLRREQERALPQAPAPGGTPLQSIRPQVSVPDFGACRDIREIRIGGALHLPDGVREAVVRDHAGRCLGAKDLEAVLATLTKSYIDRGFITTRAYLPAQDLRSGVLEITVVEGTIERFDVQQTGRGAAVSVRGAFPASPGDLLNLRDLEQGIDQINGLASNSAVLDVQPGSRPGESVVIVRNTTAFPVHLFTSYDNTGTPATGKGSGSATLSFDGLLGLNELIALTRRQTVPGDDEHKAEANALRAVVPFGYTSFSVDASESRYVNVLRLPSGQSLAAEGKTYSQSLSADRVVFRDQASRITLSARLTRQDSRNFLGGEFLPVASRTLSTLDIGPTAFAQWAGGIVNARLGLVRGLDAMGALKDAPGLPDDLPHAQFSKFTLDLGFSRRFDLDGQPVVWSSQFSGQHARDTLYGSQQILVGGIASVRGSLVNTLSGDSGYYWRNEVALPWQVATDAVALAGRVYAGYDFGRVSNRAPGVPSGSMSGLTLGAAVQWGRASLDVFASRALHLPASMKREASRVGVRLSYSL
jgi:hemolysin activation/secretion protein